MQQNGSCRRGSAHRQTGQERANVHKHTHTLEHTHPCVSPGCPGPSSGVHMLLVRVLHGARLERTRAALTAAALRVTVSQWQTDVAANSAHNSMKPPIPQHAAYTPPHQKRDARTLSLSAMKGLRPSLWCTKARAGPSLVCTYRHPALRCPSPFRAPSRTSAPVLM